MKNKMALLVWVYCRRCNVKFVDDYTNGCPVCLDYSHCSVKGGELVKFDAKLSANKNGGAGNGV